MNRNPNRPGKCRDSTAWKGVGGPTDHVKGVQAQVAFGRRTVDHGADPSAPRRSRLDVEGRSSPRASKNSFTTALVRPLAAQTTAGELVAHHGEVALAVFVLDLVDADGHQAVEQVQPPHGLGEDAHARFVDRPPTDP